MKLVGIAGTNGSGKDTVGHILARHGWLFVSVTDLLREECRHRGIDVSRENLRTISTEWRRSGGLGVLVDKAVDSYNSQSGYDGLVLASIRNPGEVDRIRELGGLTIWVDADPKVRYQRITGNDRGRTGEDQKTYEQFLAEEDAEMNSKDPNGLSMARVRELADFTVTNMASRAELEEIIVAKLGL